MNPASTVDAARAAAFMGDGGYDNRREELVRHLREVGKADGAERLALRKDTSNLFRDRARGPKRPLDLRGFNHVIALDGDAGWVEAEGMTTYEALVAATLRQDALPAIVPELQTITLGGAAAGVGIEASSFRFGLVHESLMEFDVLTGGAQVLTCRPDNEYRDLFFGFPNSYGTLGYALKLKARTVPAKPFVALEHRRFGDLDGYFAALEQQCRDGVDFVDGVAFGAGEMYLNTGRFVDSAPYVSDYTFEHVYYLSIREREADYLTTRDFVWRWDTDWFWCSRNLGAQVPWIRRLYGRQRLGSRTYQRLMRWNSRWGLTAAIDGLRGGHAESVIQDVDIPIANAAAFLTYFQKAIGIAPVWVCPVIGTECADRFPLFALQPNAMYVNFGFWDVLHRPKRFAAHHFNRAIEDKVVELGGIKSLYSDSYFDRVAFDRIYGGNAYRALKAKYDPRGEFPELYEKCVLRH